MHFLIQVALAGLTVGGMVVGSCAAAVGVSRGRQLNGHSLNTQQRVLVRRSGSMWFTVSVICFAVATLASGWR
jgi:hypothetical protein